MTQVRVLFILMLFAGLAVPSARAAAPPDATISVGGTFRTIPSSFLGLSIEYNELARYERLPAFGAFLTQLEAPGSGPLSLRVGGESADNTYLAQSEKLPGWSYFLTETWFATLANLIRRVHSKVIIDLNLAVRSTSQASLMARDTVAGLPAGSVQAFEVGNEPDLFRFGVVGVRKVRPSNPGPFRWAFSYTPQSYLSEFNSYAAAVHASAPTIRLAGPASADPSTTWWHDLPTGHGKLGLVSIHRYPFAACGAPNTPQYPTSAGFLSAAAATGLAQSVGDSVALAHQRHLPVRVTELGSASCTGSPGITDTFATALWAPDAMFSLLAAGIDGVNVHSRWNTPNTPLNGAPTLQARPLFYGLAMFARMLGPGARLLRTTVHSSTALGLSVWAVQLGDGSLHTLLINKSGHRLTASVALRSRSSALLILLRAPHPTATSAISLGGQALGADGQWHGRQAVYVIPRTASGTYQVSVPGYSAELLASR